MTKKYSRELWDEPPYLAEIDDFNVIPVYLCLNAKFEIRNHRRQRLCSWAYSEDGRTWANAAAKDILQPLNPDRLMIRVYGLIAYYRVLGFGRAQLSDHPDDVWNLRYTLAPDKRIDQKEARGGDCFLAALLQNLIGSNAAKTYGRRRDAAAIARDQHTNRVSGVISGQRATTRAFAIKQESCLGDTDRSVKQKCPVISIHGSESDLTSSPERNLKEESVADGGHEVFSIHDSESNFSSPGRTRGEGIVDIRARSPTSSIASLLPDEIPCSSQKRVKRKLHAATQMEDRSSLDELDSRPEREQLVADSFKVDQIDSEQRFHFTGHLGSPHPESLSDHAPLLLVENSAVGSSDPGVDQLAGNVFILTAVPLQL
ncbi:hypothetical protein F5Y03DRAFT_402140 [Xylaria venustula]|nr:hypothetical protein F5Y03DRAFT_402140 [Xylaria venustula]